MQNPRYLQRCVDDLAQHFPQIETIPGDRYYPTLAIKLKRVKPPATVLEQSIDITIPMARCAGYIGGTSLVGFHVHSPLHGMLAGEKTIIPFCDPVNDDVWMKSMQRFYPLYEFAAEAYLGTYHLCLNQPDRQPERPLDLVKVAFDYLAHWSQHVSALAAQHGAVVRGLVEGDIALSEDWIEHIVEHVAPGVRDKLLALAYP